MNSRVRTRAVLLGLAWPLLACDPPEPSDAGQYNLDIDLENRLGVNSHRVLVGTTFEVELAGVRTSAGPGEVDPDGGGLLCATASASGVVSKTGAIEYHVDQAGLGAVEFAAPSESCPANDDLLAELGPDRWSVRGVDPADVVASWIPAIDSDIVHWKLSPGPAATWPAGFGVPLTEALVAGDQRSTLYPLLLERDGSPHAEVRWRDPDASLNVPLRYQGLATYIDYQGERQTQSLLDGALPTGATLDASVTISARDYPLPRVEAIASTQITSIELVPLYYPSEPSSEPEREWGLPVGVSAIARDAEGRRVVGAPIDWEITRGRVARGSEDYGPDMLLLGDCRDEPKRPQWRAATVEATLDGLVSVAELEWVALPSDDIDPTSEECNASACTCTTSPARNTCGALASLALLALGLGLGPGRGRRRRARREAQIP